MADKGEKMKKIIIFLCFYCLFATPQFVSAEQARERITVDSEQNGTLILVRVYQNNLLYLSYGYFTAEHRNSDNGMPSSTAYILEETRDIFMHFDENNILTYFSTINYDRGEEFEIYFCNESEDTRRRCDDMQAMWNGLYARYDIGRRVRQVLGR
jgi:hypothetical protein